MAINSCNKLNMHMQCNQDYNNCENTAYSPSFKNDEHMFSLENPIEIITQKVDEEKKKKHNKIAIATTSTVFGVSILVALLNPRISGKLVNNLKIIQQKANANVEKNKNKFLQSNFYKFVSKTAGFGAKSANIISNANSVKDTYFKKLCTEEKSFVNKKGKTLSGWKKIDKWFRKIFQKPYEKITQWADWIAQKTVRIKYGRAAKKLDKLDSLLKSYRNRLNPSEQKIFDEKMKELAESRGYFTEQHLAERFKTQESSMRNLNEMVRNKFVEYKNGIAEIKTNKGKSLGDSLDFWAKDLMRPEQERIQKEGTEAVDRLFSSKSGTKGIYEELVDLVSPYTNQNEKHLLNKALNKGEISLRNANFKECKSYFEKKRDLTLGSAPTDVVTAIGGLSLAGVGFAAADSRDERISKSITSVAPAIAGIGTNIALTSALISGPMSLLLASLASGSLSLLGSGIDSYRTKLNSKFLATQEQNKTNNMETKNA